MNGWQKYQGVEHEFIKKEAMLLLHRDGSFGPNKVPGSEGQIDDWNGLFKEAWKTGAEVIKAGDPFEALITIAGKQTIGFSLSKFNYSQLAGLMGLVVTTFAPQVASFMTKNNFTTLTFFQGNCSLASQEDNRRPEVTESEYEHCQNKSTLHGNSILLFCSSKMSE